MSSLGIVRHLSGRRIVPASAIVGICIFINMGSARSQRLRRYFHGEGSVKRLMALLLSGCVGTISVPAQTPVEDLWLSERAFERAITTKQHDAARPVFHADGRGTPDTECPSCEGSPPVFKRQLPDCRLSEIIPKRVAGSQTYTSSDPRIASDNVA